MTHKHVRGYNSIFIDGMFALAHLQQVLSSFGVIINNTGVSRDEKESLPPFRAQAVYTVNNILVETKTPVQCERIRRGRI